MMSQHVGYVCITCCGTLCYGACHVGSMFECCIAATLRLADVVNHAFVVVEAVTSRLSYWQCLWQHASGKKLVCCVVSLKGCVVSVLGRCSHDAALACDMSKSLAM